MPTKDKIEPAGNGISPVEQMKRVMSLEATQANRSGDAAAQIQEAILSAGSDDDVFGAAEGGLPSGEDLIGVPMRILRYELQKSTIADAPMPVFAVIDAEKLETGEGVTFSIGGASTLAQLWRWAQLKPFDERRDGILTAIESKRTQAGFDVLFFRALSPAEKGLAGALNATADSSA